MTLLQNRTEAYFVASSVARGRRKLREPGLAKAALRSAKKSGFPGLERAASRALDAVEVEPPSDVEPKDTA